MISPYSHLLCTPFPAPAPWILWGLFVWFSAVWICYASVGFFFKRFFSLSCFVFTEFPLSVVWCLTWIWGKLSVIIASNISSIFPFFSFCYSHFIFVTPFVVVAQSLDILFYFNFLSFSLYFSVLKVSVDMFPSSEMLSSAMSCPLWSPSKAFFISKFMVW